MGKELSVKAPDKLNLVLGYSAGSCILKSLLAVFLGLDLHWCGCRASCSREGPAEGGEGRAGSIPSVLARAGRCGPAV